MILLTNCMVQDRMKEYRSPISRIFKGAGVTGIILGAAGSLGDNSTAYTLAGGSALVTGYLADAVSYMRGYFNERLDILEKQLKSDGLEKKLEK